MVILFYSDFTKINSVSFFDIFNKFNLIFSVFRLMLLLSFGGNHAGSINSNTRFFASNTNVLGRYRRCARETRRQKFCASFIKLFALILANKNDLYKNISIMLVALFSAIIHLKREQTLQKFTWLAILTCNGPDLDCIMSESSV